MRERWVWDSSHAMRILRMLSAGVVVRGLSTTTTTTATTKKCLLLHGKGSSGVRMRADFERRIVGALPEFAFFVPTSPLPLDDDTAQWWRLRAGERSFAAAEYVDLGESVSFVRAYCDRNGPFDCAWGHSQGAIFLAAALARPALRDCLFGPAPPSRFVLNGAAWPKPFEADLLSLRHPPAETLHCLDLDDPVNPSDQAIRLADIFKGRRHVHTHGHRVPDDDDALSAYRSFLL
mmetsp:Transcript_7208/g.22196  ORF Transcript_7208/g.22196 Transcript_7208/m.22196 type:complete len:234 (-) Transcript_7208:1013-1714(-)